MQITPQIEPTWKAALQYEFQQNYFLQLKQFLVDEKRQRHQIFPKGKDIFNAFALTPVPLVKVVILGQDPYHGVGQAHGLAFSVPTEIATPPSLKNIYQELHADVNFTIPYHGDLTQWAKQGVLLLNTVLTVRAHQAHSHRGQGWEQFTDATIRYLSETNEHLVFVLWGSPAKTKQAMIDSQRHLILTAPHPSPLSAHRGFFGCRHFSKINQYLEQQGKTPIDWQL